MKHLIHGHVVKHGHIVKHGHLPLYSGGLGDGVWGSGGGGFTCVTSFDLFLSYLAICCNNRAFLTTKPPRFNDLFYNYSYLTSRPASMVELSCAGDMLMKRVNENSLFTSEIRQGYKINTLEEYTPNI